MKSSASELGLSVRDETSQNGGDENCKACNYSVNSSIDAITNSLKEDNDNREMELNPKKCKEMLISFLKYSLPCNNASHVCQKRGRYT